MPQATLSYSPAYVFVGLYRLVHDPKLWRPMWDASRAAVRRAGIVTIAWITLSLPVQSFVAYMFMAPIGRMLGAKATYSLLQSGTRHVRLPLPSFEAVTKTLLIVNQVNFIFEMFLAKQLRSFRRTAYMDAVESRGKPPDWWTAYTEEWQQPPSSATAPRTLSLSGRLVSAVRNRLLERLFRRVVRLLFSSIPLFGLFFSAGASAVPCARALHRPLFEMKRMSPQQIDVWVEERRTSYWLFGFTAELAERIPFAGIVFSISNRIGAAMWAHDLEKRQHRFRDGELQPLHPDETSAPLPPPKDAPGGYAHPQHADVPLPGAMVDAAPGAPFAQLHGGSGARRRPVPRVPHAAT
ncbi:hypothetical protein MSPP1_002257 [Malassezia sp. CBS 17886]|nr:hypothetical protein MSPP1_002257 [Malassezia sp. CBS 17886]